MSECHDVTVIDLSNPPPVGEGEYSLYCSRIGRVSSHPQVCQGRCYYGQRRSICDGRGPEYPSEGYLWASTTSKSHTDARLGSVGELYVGGTTLALRYGRDDLTKDRFMPHPFTGGTNLPMRARIQHLDAPISPFLHTLTQFIRIHM